MNVASGLVMFLASASAFSLFGTNSFLRKGAKQDPICQEPGDPSLTVITNADIGEGKKALLKGISDAIIASTGKPESYVAAAVLDNQAMIWGADTEIPCALCTFNSLGAVNVENNAKLQASITALLEPYGIAPTKIYTTFNDIARENMGYDGRTFAGATF